MNLIGGIHVAKTFKLRFSEDFWQIKKILIKVSTDIL